MQRGFGAERSGGGRAASARHAPPDIALELRRWEQAFLHTSADTSCRCSGALSSSLHHPSTAERDHAARDAAEQRRRVFRQKEEHLEKRLTKHRDDEKDLRQFKTEQSSTHAAKIDERYSKARDATARSCSATLQSWKARVSIVAQEQKKSERIVAACCANGDKSATRQRVVLHLRRADEVEQLRLAKIHARAVATQMATFKQLLD